jgi:hypothetical protein
MSFGPGAAGQNSTLNVAASTVIATTPATGPKRTLFTIVVTTAGAAGAVYDTTTVGAIGAANLIAVVPATVGPVTLNWPCSAGIVYVPGAAQVANFSWT